MGILIKNIMIVSMDDSIGVMEKGNILIEGEKIDQISQGDYDGSLEGIHVINGAGYCAVPGLMNCHTHAAMTLLRGFGEGLPLMKWLNEKIWPAEARFTERHIEIGTRLACLEMMRSGTVAFNDMYFYQDKVMEVARDFNIKVVCGIPIMGEEWGKQLKEAENLIKKVKKYGNGMIKSMLAPHSPYTLSEEALKAIGNAAEVLESGIHIHIAETRDEIKFIKDKYNKSPCELLEKCGVLMNRTVGAHCVYLSDTDIEILRRNKVNAVYNPESNMKLASGVSPVIKMLKNGINVCFGTDGASSNNNLNMFEEIQTGAMLQKLWNCSTTVLDGKSVLSMATVNGAKALGFNDSGIIRKGACADIILLNLKKPNMTPIHDIYSNLVFSANGSEVEYVIINGKIVMDKGEFVGIDEEKIIYEANDICREFI